MSVPAGTFPATCECPAKRGKCAGNETDCQLWWVVAQDRSAQPSLAGRLFGWLAAFVGWRR